MLLLQPQSRAPPPQLVVEMFYAPANLALAGDGVDRRLERRIGEGVAILRLECELFVAAAAHAGLALFVWSVRAAVDASHSAPPGFRPRPSMNTRIHASSIASVQ